MRTAPTFTLCPWCGKKLNHSALVPHMRDTGTLDVRPVDACVVLFDLRNEHREVLGA